MKITFDPKADSLYIEFQPGKGVITKKMKQGIVVDSNKKGKLFGIEIIGVSDRVSLKNLQEISLNLPVTTNK